MQELQLYEYAIIRIVPRVEREEFLNVGVVLYCNKQKLLLVKYYINPHKFTAAFPTLQIAEVQSYLAAFEQICNGTNMATPISQLPAAARFRWLSATRSTIIQTSKVHPGFCVNPQLTLQKLMAEMVL